MISAVKTSMLVGGAILTLFGAAGCTPASSNDTQANSINEPVAQVAEVNKADEVPKVVTKSESSDSKSDPKYLAFTDELYASTKGSEPFALFFHADWCPTCRGMEKDFKENLSSLPEGATIIQADYDKETDLKKEYGITMQSIVVVIDEKGNVSETLVSPNSSALKNALAKVL